MRPAAELPALLAPGLSALAEGAIPPIYFAAGVQMIPLRTVGLPPSSYTNAYLVGSEQLYLFDPGAHEAEEQQRLFALVDARMREKGRLQAVVLTHHHPDHTLNAALFPNARFHDHWAIYQDDNWDDRDADGFQVTENVRLLRTPGHSAEDISTLVTTAEGLVVLTHLWWSAEGPAEDPFADQEVLTESRAKVLALDPATIIPGHGPAFTPSAETPR